MPRPKTQSKGLLLATALLISVCVQDLNARELRIDPEDLVAVELAGVGVSATAGAPLVLLRHLETGDVVPIIIGLDQARAILMAMHGVEPPRPMTHDLATSMISALGATLERVLVDELVGNTFYGMLELRVPGQEDPIRVDSRPSDALALAVRTGASIHVAPAVLVAGEDLDYEGLPDRQVVTALGITVVEAGEDERQALDLPDRPGVLVRRLVGAAARSDLEPGSLILEVNDTTVRTPMDFLEAVRDTGAGAKVQIRYWQDGSEHTLELAPSAGAREPGQPMISA
ncbi:MAG: bifunctional nuclease family protein [Gammaproteobacteria bacterium]|nr:bifunctional nuclease family protein [Gammaproteobacteria bacterium]